MKRCFLIPIRTVAAMAIMTVVPTAHAEYSPSHIRVRAITYRPGCDLPESALEIYNSNTTYSYKVHAQGEYKNSAGGPATCVLGGNSINCGTTFSHDFILDVCDGNEPSCDSWGPQLPGCDNPPPYSCDNPSCDSSSWCSTFFSLLVTITHYREGSSGDWIDLTPDEVVCVRGSYGSTPYCDGESYCSFPNLNDACVFSPSPPMVQQCIYE